MFRSFHRNPANFERHLRPDGADRRRRETSNVPSLRSNSERKVNEVELRNDGSAGQLGFSASRSHLPNGGAPAPVAPGTFEEKSNVTELGVSGN